MTIFPPFSFLVRLLLLWAYLFLLSLCHSYTVIQLLSVYPCRVFLFSFLSTINHPSICASSFVYHRSFFNLTYGFPLIKSYQNNLSIAQQLVQFCTALSFIFLSLFGDTLWKDDGEVERGGKPKAMHAFCQTSGRKLAKQGTEEEMRKRGGVVDGLFTVHYLQRKVHNIAESSSIHICKCKISHCPFPETRENLETPSLLYLHNDDELYRLHSAPFVLSMLFVLYFSRENLTTC